ncbi:hypothetical protein L7F22_020925 [Adiantum nelumboides]|nr:hypothetical protein [Adiantum nelumboides]
MGTQGKQSNLFTSWHPQRKTQVDATVPKSFYSCGISFNVARSPFFKEMVAEIAQFGPTYQPPTFDALREKLLEDEVASIKEAILPVRQKWEAYGVSLVEYTRDLYIGFHKAENDPGSVRDAGDKDNEEEDEEEQFEAQDCEDNDEEATPEIVVDHDVEL